jgi:lipid-binding SYLF domain-containing protein
MKTLVIGLILVGLNLSAAAASRADLDQRLRGFAAKFEEMQAKPDKRIPADALRRACGIIMVQRAGGGFVLGYQGGNGVAMIKNAQTGQWSAPAFVNFNEGTFGAQIGGQTSFTVILLMNTNCVRMVTEPDFEFGGEARGTAGNSSSAKQNDTSPLEPLTLAYSDTSGLYGGAVVKGGGLTPDTDADVTYYGEYLTPREILSGNRVKPTAASVYLADKINQFSK